jgi:hypothetical protein
MAPRRSGRSRSIHTFARSTLVSIVDVAGQHVVQFSHFSVREIFTSKHCIANSALVSYFHVLSRPVHILLIRWICGRAERLLDGVQEMSIRCADILNSSTCVIQQETSEYFVTLVGMWRNLDTRRVQVRLHYTCCQTCRYTDVVQA